MFFDHLLEPHGRRLEFELQCLMVFFFVFLILLHQRGMHRLRLCNVWCLRGFNCGFFSYLLEPLKKKNVSFVFRPSPISCYYSGKFMQSFAILMTLCF